LINFVDLTAFSSDKPLHLELVHENGTKDVIAVNHTYNAQQIEWFKAGGALNLIRKSIVS
jgi:aconitate hydratase